MEKLVKAGCSGGTLQMSTAPTACFTIAITIDFKKRAELIQLIGVNLLSQKLGMCQFAFIQTGDMFGFTYMLLAFR